MASFATAQDLRTYLSGEALTDPLDPLDVEWVAQANLLLELVTGDMQAAARSPIIVPDVVVSSTIPGTWERELVLPRRPVVSVVSVTVDGVELAVDAYRWNSRQIIRRGGALPDVGYAGELGGGTWGGPDSTVSVVYGAGYTADNVPGWVRSMALRVAARSIANPTSMTQQSFGGYAETFARVIDSGGSHLTPEETRVLRQRFSKTSGSIGGRGR